MRKLLALALFALALGAALVTINRAHISRADAARSVRALCEVPRAACGNLWQRATKGDFRLGGRSRSAAALRRELGR